MSCYELQLDCFTAELMLWRCFKTAPELKFYPAPLSQQNSNGHKYTCTHIFQAVSIKVTKERKMPHVLGFPPPSQYFTRGFGSQQLCHTGSSTEERQQRGVLSRSFPQRCPWQDQLPRCWSQHRVLGCQVSSQVLPEVMEEIVLLEMHNQVCSECSVL